MTICLSFFLGLLIILSLTAALFKTICWQDFVVTLFLVAAPIPFFAYTNISIIKYYLAGVTALSIVMPILRRSEYILAFRNLLYTVRVSIGLNEIMCFLVSILAALFVTWNQAPWNWYFETHDVLYYGWINEVFNASYIGPVRVTTMYPSELSANHLLPGALLLPFLSLVHNSPFFSAYCAKYILTTFAISWLGFVLSRRVKSLFLRNDKSITGKNVLFYCFYTWNAFLIPFLIYGPELEYNLSVSTFAVIIPIYAAASLVIDPGKSDNKIDTFHLHSMGRRILYLFICAAFAKATTFPVFFFAIISILVPWDFLADFSLINIKEIPNNMKRYVFSLNVFKFWVPFVLGISIILSWKIPASKHGSLALASPLCLIQSLLESNNSLRNCIASFVSNPFAGWIVPGHKIPFVSLFPMSSFIYIWMFILLPLALVSLYFVKESVKSVDKLFFKLTAFYALYVGAAVVLLRESVVFAGMHTSHSYFIAASLLIPLIQYALTEQYIFDLVLAIKFKISHFLIAVFMSFIYFFQMPLMTAYSRVTRSDLSDSGIRPINRLRPVASIHQLNNFDVNGCLLDRHNTSNIIKANLDEFGCAQKPLLELLHSVRNIKSNASGFTGSIINQWSLPGNE